MVKPESRRVEVVPHRVEGMSAERAKSLLGSGKNFRDLDRKHAARIADALRLNPRHLVEDGTPIRVTRDGVLKDGQHRLHAIVMLRTGDAIPIVVQVVEDDWWGDHGKKRTEGDYLRNEIGPQDQHSKFVAIAKGIHNLLSADVKRFKASSAENILDTTNEWLLEIKWALTDVGLFWAGNPARMATGGAGTQIAFALAKRAYPTAAESLIARCRSGEVDGPQDPAAALRRHIARVSGPGSEAKTLCFVGSATAIKAETQGKRVGLIRAGGTTEEIMSAVTFLTGGGE